MNHVFNVKFSALSIPVIKIKLLYLKRYFVFGPWERLFRTISRSPLDVPLWVQQLLSGSFSLKITSFQVIRDAHLKWDTLYKNYLWIHAFLHMLTRFHRTRWLISMPRFRFIFVSWDNIYLLFLNIQSPWHLGTNFIYCEADKTSKIVLYLVSLIWVFSGRFLSSYLHKINNIQ